MRTEQKKKNYMERNGVLSDEWNIAVKHGAEWKTWAILCVSLGSHGKNKGGSLFKCSLVLELDGKRRLGFGKRREVMNVFFFKVWHRRTNNSRPASLISRLTNCFSYPRTQRHDDTAPWHLIVPLFPKTLDSSRRKSCTQTPPRFWLHLHPFMP